MLDDVYNAKIIEYAGNIQRIGRIEDRHATAKAHSKLCGSTVIVDLKMEDGIVTDFAHEVKACALGQAASSIMAKTVIGSSAQELKDLKKTAYAMLKDGGAVPGGKFEEFKFLEPVKDYKARHASTLLTFDAVVDCIEEIEAARQTAKDNKKAQVKRDAVKTLKAAGIRFSVRK